MCVQSSPLEDMEIVKDHRDLSVCLVVRPKFQDVIFLVFRLAKRLFKDLKSRESTKKENLRNWSAWDDENISYS